MLQLKRISKDYITGEQIVNALTDVSVNFRDSEFVSILGQSGCGKTTLLNIIGGLDSYTDGDLIIDGVSTKDFKNREWDNYRNHQIGFVFQNYDLINHQTVIGNVELALILSGVSKDERRRRSLEALKEVGLDDVANKLPNQLSGGQMQRVAIARAIVNNPKIILADEPTGALDSETSIQVMEILKRLSNDRLVIMVTHNPELAKKYSTRIVKLKDGVVASDNNKFIPSEEDLDRLKRIHEEKVKEFKDLKKRRLIFLSERKLKMSFKTAFLLSLKNLFSKKGRTILTSVAGSIGIIGIALISSISTGVNTYIDKMEQETLSQYPIQLERNSIDYTKFLNIIMNRNDNVQTVNSNKILINDALNSLLDTYSSSGYSNDLKSFKKFIDSNSPEAKKLKDAVSSIDYLYKHQLNIYLEKNQEITKVSPENLYDEIIDEIQGGSVDKTIMTMLGDQFNTFGAMLPSVDETKLFNEELIYKQYELVAKEKGSRWPVNENECLLVLDKNSTINDYSYYALGLGDKNDIYRILDGQEVNRPDSLAYNEILNLEYKIILPTSSYEPFSQVEVDNHTMNLYHDTLVKDDKVDQEVLRSLFDKSEINLKVVGIVKPKFDTSSPCIKSTIAYSPKLIEKCNEFVKQSPVYKEQSKEENKNYSVFTGRRLSDSFLSKDELINNYLLTVDEETKNKYSEDLKPYTMNYLKNSFLSVFNIVDRLEGTLSIKLINSETGTTNQITRQVFLSYFDLKYDEFVSTFITNSEFDYIEFDAVNSQETIYHDSLEVSQLFKTYSHNAYLDFYAEIMGDYYMSYDDCMNRLGVNESEDPFRIYIYAKDFSSKDEIIKIISNYNSMNQSKQISYTDYVGIIMSSISTIVNSITYVLIGLVSISLVVSSIMIGIITYISVLERIKEIGILRSLGASNKDIFTLFNAETITLGFCSGGIGILVTSLINVPLNMILNTITGIGTFVSLRPLTAVLLIFISIILTFISGLIPSQLASKKNPVIALRSE